MPIYANIGGAQKELSAVYANIGGAQKEINPLLANISGAEKIIMEKNNLFEIGSPAIYSSSVAMPYGYTVINRNNPASSDGYIDELQIFVRTAFSNCIIAIYHETSNNVFTARARYIIGGAQIGINTYQDASHLFRVYPGDYIGIYLGGGEICSTANIGNGFWFSSGDQTQCVDKKFTLNLQSNHAPSLYGKGIAL